MQVKATSEGYYNICFAHALTQQAGSASLTMGFSVLAGSFSFQ
jgi:hypothetical protein